MGGRRAWFYCAPVFLLAAAAAFGQKATGEIRGTVLDPSNAAVAKATVVATDVGTGISQSTPSTPEGAYLIPNLAPGTYEVVITATGFLGAVYQNVVIDTDRTTSVAAHLAVGAVTETVEVSDAATQLETQSTLVATTVRNDYIRNLPTGGRDVLQFAQLTAGYAGSGGYLRTIQLRGYLRW